MNNSSYLLILAVALACFSSQIDDYFKSIIPDDKKRNFLLTSVLVILSLIYGVVSFRDLIAQHTLPISLFLSAFPLLMIITAKLIHIWVNKE